MQPTRFAVQPTRFAVQPTRFAVQPTRFAVELTRFAVQPTRFANELAAARFELNTDDETFLLDHDRWRSQNYASWQLIVNSPHFWQSCGICRRAVQVVWPVVGSSFIQLNVNQEQSRGGSGHS